MRLFICQKSRRVCRNGWIGFQHKEYILGLSKTIYLWKCVLLRLSCYQTACVWMTGRKRSHSHSIQLTAKRGASGDKVATWHYYYCVMLGSCTGMDYDYVIAVVAGSCSCSLAVLDPRVGHTMDTWCGHSMLASLLWRCLTVPSLLQLC